LKTLGDAVGKFVALLFEFIQQYFIGLAARTKGFG
jgi:hypothetical protein